MSTLNAQVVAVSIDSPFANKGFADHNKLPFPVLSDFYPADGHNLYGAARELRGYPGYSTAKRAVFVLDGQGSVRYTWITRIPGLSRRTKRSARPSQVSNNRAVRWRRGMSPLACDTSRRTGLSPLFKTRRVAFVECFECHSIFSGTLR